MRREGSGRGCIELRPKFEQRLVVALRGKGSAAMFSCAKMIRKSLGGLSVAPTCTQTL